MFKKIIWNSKQKYFNKYCIILSGCLSFFDKAFRVLKFHKASIWIPLNCPAFDFIQNHEILWENFVRKPNFLQQLTHIIISHTIGTIVYGGPHNRFIRNTDLFIRATCGLGRTTLMANLVLNAWHMVLLTQMAKFCHAIRPPCSAKEPPPAEAFSCLDTDFTQ